MSKKKIREMISRLEERYDASSWWPVTSKRNKRFEICVGAILTQNTAWKNVEKAIENLKNNGLLSPKKMLTVEEEEILRCIRPAGYFNQKTKKLKLFAQFYKRLGRRPPTRDELLSLWGVGPETADTIILYAYGELSFVVDAYTKRILLRLGIVNEKATYDEMKRLFEDVLEPDVKTYQICHGLFVEHAKALCRKRPLCEDCFLKESCRYYDNTILQK